MALTSSYRPLHSGHTCWLMRCLLLHSSEDNRVLREEIGSPLARLPLHPSRARGCRWGAVPLPWLPARSGRCLHFPADCTICSPSCWPVWLLPAALPAQCLLTLLKCPVPGQEHLSRLCHRGGGGHRAALVPSPHCAASASIWVTACAWGSGSCGCAIKSHLLSLLLFLAAARL